MEMSNRSEETLNTRIRHECDDDDGVNESTNLILSQKVCVPHYETKMFRKFFRSLHTLLGSALYFMSSI